ncbi:uncharacterized protein LOC144646856 [Oculina patagonica]
MTRKQSGSDDLCHFQCGISNCQMTKGNKTIDSAEVLNTDERIKDLCNGVVMEAQDKEMDSKQTDSNVVTCKDTATKQDSIPVEIERKQNSSSVVRTNGDSEYVSLNLHIWKRTKSDGAIHKKRKPNCYFGRKDTEDKRTLRSRSAEVGRRQVQNEAGISESPVFFSAIGEWTIVDLNLQVFEKEDANRIHYLRRKRTSYKEVEPENVCCIL